MIWLLIIPVITYSLLIITVFRSLAGIRNFKPSAPTAKRISVVIACKNEEADIPILLGDIAAQDYDPDLFEVIVIDDSSSDNTHKIASSFKTIKRIKVLSNNGQGKKSALRTGIEAADGELIITADADCRIGGKWIRTIASFHEETKPDLVIAPVLLPAGRGFFHRFQELEFCSLQGITAGTAAMGNPVMCNGANMAFPRVVYLEHANHIRDNIASGDDIFLLQSVKRDKNAKIMWLESEDAAATTRLSGTIPRFLRQRGRWISKFRAYNDRFSMVLGIVTFVTISELLFFALAGIFDHMFFILLSVALFIKSSADLLILAETSRRRNKTGLLKWFIPSQLIYPFYVLIVSIISLFRKNKW